MAKIGTLPEADVIASLRDLNPEDTAVVTQAQGSHDRTYHLAIHRGSFVVTCAARGCGKVFKAGRDGSAYCSATCRQRAYRDRTQTRPAPEQPDA